MAAQPIAMVKPITEAPIATTPVQPSKKRVKPVVKEAVAKEEPTIPSKREVFYERLLERVEKLTEIQTQPVSVTVETTEGHIERLVELKQHAYSCLIVFWRIG